MFKPLLTVSVLALTALAWPQDRPKAIVPLRGAAMHLEWSPGKEVVVRVSAESEDELANIRFFHPDGRELFELTSRSRSNGGLAGLEIELHQPDVPTLLQNYAEGVYSVRANTLDGRVAAGNAILSCALPQPPLVLHPEPGQIVRAPNLTVIWAPDPGVVAYDLQVEQGEDDGIRIRLPPAESSFRIPFRLLKAGQEAHLELVAIADNGNRTLSEVSFVPMP